MFITIHCGGLAFNGNTIKESSLGGSETAAYYMAKELAADGNNVTIFTSSMDEGLFDNVRYVYAGTSSERYPLGDRFHQYAENTPTDVLIIQRAPFAFATNFPAKIKLLWLHDLAHPSQKEQIQQAMFYIDGILTVSKMHKEQVVAALGINPDIVYPIQNGVDLSLFEGGMDISKFVAVGDVSHKQVRLLYTSRPERGLEHLVKPDGIMSRLIKDKPEAHLYVCGYENTTAQMEGYYKAIWQMCEDLPNVTNLGALNKQELADVMRQCDLHVYPTPSSLTPDFKEVSCITVMECAAAGLPMLTSNVGALPETSEGLAVELLDLKDGLPNVDKFVERIIAISNDTALLSNSSELQLKEAPKFNWSIAAEMVTNVIKNIFNKASDTSKLKELIHLSDIQAAKYLLDSIEAKRALNEIELQCKKELKMCYGFFFNDDFDNHYKNYYEYEKARGVNYGAEKMEGNPRFETVAAQIAALPEGAVVMDYGCAHGHYTITLAKRFKDKRFIGVDITESNVIKARDWAKDEDIENVEFYHGRVDIVQGIIINKSVVRAKVNSKESFVAGLSLPRLDAVIAAEVIEHVAHPVEHVDVLSTYLKDNGLMIVTTPYGGWEAIGYEEHHPWRAHIHHFEREDLHDVWGAFPNFGIMCVPSGVDNKGYAIGSYVTVFNIDDTGGLVGNKVNYDRKLATMLPKETISLCMIVKDGEDTLRSCLDSIKDTVDEVRLSVDANTSDRTYEVIANFIEDNKLWPVVTVNTVESPLKIGFDAARNFNIKGACADWVMWLDADEVMSYASRIKAYVQHNQYNGYALKQHHIAAEPVGVLKTDYPVRLFRNKIGVKFHGVVHEHPELKMNEGVGHAIIIPDTDIMHHGYTNEAIRRKRFDRNINLMARDREENPERLLGKFLWLRDIAQMTRYELEAGAPIHPPMQERCKEGIKMFEELLDANQLRMLSDGMEWYSICAGVLGAKFQAAFTVDAGNVRSEFKPQGKTISAMFLTKEHITKLFNALLNEKVKDYE